MNRPRRRPRAFTLVEVLAAMVFLAIVLPAALGAITLSNRAAQMASRKQTAVQIADRLLSESVVTQSWNNGDEEGDCGTDWPGYRYSLRSQDWESGTVREVTVEVFFQVQGREFSVTLTTLAEEVTA